MSATRSGIAEKNLDEELLNDEHNIPNLDPYRSHGDNIYFIAARRPPKEMAPLEVKSTNQKAISSSVTKTKSDKDKNSYILDDALLPLEIGELRHSNNPEEDVRERL